MNKEKLKEFAVNTIVSAYLLWGGVLGYNEAVLDNQICHIQKKSNYLIITEYDGDKKQILKWNKGKSIYEKDSKPPKEYIENKNSCHDIAKEFGLLYPGAVIGAKLEEKLNQVTEAKKDEEGLILNPSAKNAIRFIYLPVAKRYIDEPFFNSLPERDKKLFNYNFTEDDVKKTTEMVLAGNKEEIKRVLMVNNKWRDAEGNLLNEKRNCYCSVNPVRLFVDPDKVKKAWNDFKKGIQDFFK